MLTVGVAIDCDGSGRAGAGAVGSLDSSGEPPGGGDERPEAELAELPDAELLGEPAEGCGDDTGGGARGGGGGSLGEADDTWERNRMIPTANEKLKQSFKTPTPPHSQHFP